MKMLQWLNKATTPTRRPLTPEEYLYATPYITTGLLLAFSFAFWRHNSFLIGLALFAVVEWYVFVPFILPRQLSRWQSRQSFAKASGRRK